MKEFKSPARIVVTGFEITSPGFDECELIDAAAELAGEIGSALSSLGTGCVHGEVTIECDGQQATSADVEREWEPR